MAFSIIDLAVTAAVTFAISVATAFWGRGLYRLLLFFLVIELVVWWWRRAEISMWFLYVRLALIAVAILGYVVGRWAVGDDKPVAWRAEDIRHCNDAYFCEWLLWR